MCLCGGPHVHVSDLLPVSRGDVAAAIDPKVRERVLELDLTKHGIESGGAFPTLGFGFPQQPAAPEVFVDGHPMRLSRWPKRGYLHVKQVCDEGGTKSNEKVCGAVFACDDQRMTKWCVDRGIGCFGYWFFDWASSQHPVQQIEGDRVCLAGPTKYGVSAAGQGQGGRFRFLNVLEELSEPGEFCIDRRSGMLYLIPPENDCKTFMLSALAQPLMVLRDARSVHLQGFIFEGGRGDGVAIEGGSDNALIRCEIRNCGGRGALVSGMANRVQGCHLHDLGQGGIVLDGGDRRELQPAANVIEDCDIHHYNRVDPCYRPGIAVNGVGHRIRHNHVHQAPHFGIWVHGNDHVVELNELDHLCLDTSDCGAFYMGRNPSERGVVVRHNYFHHIGSGLHQGESAVYFDDGSTGTVTGNVFYKAGTIGNARMGAIFVHAGKDVLIENNLFIECDLAVGIMPAGREQWEDFLHGRLPGCDYVREWLFEDVDVTAPPYTTAYPALHDLDEFPDRNTIRHNIAYKCSEFLSVNRCRRRDGFESFEQEMTGNLFTDVDPGFVDFDDGDFRLRPDSKVFHRIPGFRPIPIGHRMGTDHI